MQMRVPVLRANAHRAPDLEWGGMRRSAVQLRLIPDGASTFAPQSDQAQSL